MLNTIDHYEKEIIRNNISNDIIVNSILNKIEKFKDEDGSNINLLYDMDQKFNFLIKVKYQDDPKEIIEYKNSLYEKFLNLLKDKIGFTTEISPETVGHDKFAIYVSAIYEFFIIRFIPNHIQYLFNEVFDNKKFFIGSYKDDTLEGKDLKFTNLRKYFKNLDNTILIANINSIFKDIFKEYYYENFINSIINSDPDEFTNNIIKELFMNEIHSTALNDKFNKNYKLNSRDLHYNYILFSTENNIRSKLIPIS